MYNNFLFCERKKYPESIKVYSFFPLMLSGLFCPPLGVAVSPFSATPFFIQISGFPEQNRQRTGSQLLL